MASQLAERIIEVPELYERREASTATLLKETGFLEAPDALDVGDVEDALSQRPKLAEDWLKRGHDQQIVGGWGIERDHGQYRVQNFGSGMHMREPDRVHATAEFVVRYVRFIGDVLRRTDPDGIRAQASRR